MIIPQQPAKSFATLDLTVSRFDFFAGLDDLVAETLVGFLLWEFHKRNALHGAPLESVVDAIVSAMDAGPTDPVSVDR